MYSCWMLCLLEYDKILMETGKFSDNIRVTENGLASGVEYFSRRILRFRTSAIDLIHSERVSASTSSFFAHRLAYSSHPSMIMPKFWCHEYETGSLYFGPLLKRSLSFTLRTILRSQVWVGVEERIDYDHQTFSSSLYGISKRQKCLDESRDESRTPSHNTNVWMDRYSNYIVTAVIIALDADTA